MLENFLNETASFKHSLLKASMLQCLKPDLLKCDFQGYEPKR